LHSWSTIAFYALLAAIPPARLVALGLGRANGPGRIRLPLDEPVDILVILPDPGRFELHPTGLVDGTRLGVRLPGSTGGAGRSSGMPSAAAGPYFIRKSCRATIPLRAPRITRDEGITPIRSKNRQLQ
jgi:hypothetical protein